jgi:hypothetical protein
VPVVLGLCGYAGSGKDCAAQGLIKQGWARVSFADGIREMALRINPMIYEPVTTRMAVAEHGWEGAKAKYPAIRKLLQNLGTAARDTIHEDVWVDVADSRASALLAKGVNVVFTDVRFPNEVQTIYGWGSHEDHEVAIVRITRPGVGPVNNHISETAIDDITPDFEIENSGTPEELQEKLVAYAESLSDCTKVEG